MMEKEQLVSQAVNLKLSLNEAHSYIAVFGVGVVAGFVSRRFLKLAILSVLVSLIIIKGLEFQNILKIDWQTVTSFFGIDANISMEQLVKDLYIMASENLYLTGALIIGFLIGYRGG